jgi:hypothetical protein
LRPSGYFTAACGVTVYRAGLFPRSHHGSLFVCDAAQNLVHRALLLERGTTLLARRADEGTEFLRASDPWFRPVNLHVGPEGALYVLDFYREIIETAASIPPDILETLDLRAGAELGRIYRITPTEAPGYSIRTMDAMSEEDLIAGLADPNAWRRTTAQRLLIERDTRSDAALQALRRAALDGEDSRGRLHALWTLEGLDALDDATLLAALDDPHPRLREHALRLARRAILRTSGDAMPRRAR